MPEFDELTRQWLTNLWALSWQFSLLVSAVFIFSLLVSKASAGFRYWLWCIALLRLCLPLGWLAPPQMGIAVPDPPEVRLIVFPLLTPEPSLTLPVGDTVPTTARPQLENRAPALTSPAVTSKVPPGGYRLSAAGYVFCGWLVASALAVGMVLWRGAALHWKLRRACPVQRADLLELVEKCRRRSGMKRSLKLCWLDGASVINGPFVFGLLRPQIVLPRRMAEHWELAALEPILLHEMAHLRRYDLVINCIQLIVQILYFFHPLVWYVNWKISQERELACDDLALFHLGGKRKQYTRTLLRVIEEFNHGLFFAFATTGLAERHHFPIKRIIRMLNHNYSGYRQMHKVAVGLLIVLAIFSMAICSQQPAPSGEKKQPERTAISDMSQIVDQLRLYHKSHGHYPQKLDQLAAKLPTDIHSSQHKSYNYETGRGLVKLESCGPDGIHGNDDDIMLALAPGFAWGGSRSKFPYVSWKDGQLEYSRSSAPRPHGNCSIFGRVIAAKTGKPIGHATVYLFYVDIHYALFIHTASDGSFNFKNIPTGEYRLQTTRTQGFQNAIYNPQNKSGWITFNLKAGEKREVKFRLNADYSISGKVDVGPAKLSKGRITVIAWVKNASPDSNGMIYEMAAQSSVRNGRYQLDGLDGRAVYVMAMDWNSRQHEDYYPPCYYPGTIERGKAKLLKFTGQNRLDNIDFKLAKSGGVAVEGTVKSEDGKPIAEALVVIHHRDMLFDRVIAYTDANGSYRIAHLGAGEYLAHVDASPQGYVRTRKMFSLSGQQMRLNLVLKPGVKISGRFVDAKGQPASLGRKSYGYSQLVDWQHPGGGFSGVSNKLLPKSVIRSAAFFVASEGDYGEQRMLYPSKSSFVIYGMAPGNTQFTFKTKIKNIDVIKIVYQGKDITKSGLVTQSGTTVSGIEIVIDKQP